MIKCIRISPLVGGNEFAFINEEWCKGFIQFINHDLTEKREIFNSWNEFVRGQYKPIIQRWHDIYWMYKAAYDESFNIKTSE